MLIQNQIYNISQCYFINTARFNLLAAKFLIGNSKNLIDISVVATTRIKVIPISNTLPSMP